MNARFKPFIIYFIIPVSLYILFSRSIEYLLTKFVVDPVLSKCEPANWLFDLSVIMLVTAYSIPLSIKSFKGAEIAQKWFWIGLGVLLIYIYYRFVNVNIYTFFPYKIYGNIKLLDTFLVIPFLIALSYCFNKLKSKKKKSTNAQGFLVDEPKFLQPENDLLSRGKFAKTLSTQICNTQAQYGSFTIGIVAPWGAGKTTFMKSLEQELPDSSCIKISLNVWKCKTSNQIIEAFFSLLKNELKKYSFTIDNVVESYSNHLLKGIENTGLNTVKNALGFLTPAASHEEEYEKINVEISKIKKRIIVFIDDLDRLDKTEIYETIRLIRNTANFRNTFFIVTYDRNYVINALSQISQSPHYYLEKIFQLEFTLPPIHFATIQKELNLQLNTFLSSKAKQAYDKMQEHGFSFSQYYVCDLASLYIENLRDVTRYVNSLRLRYEFVKDEIFFPDFYNLELLRFKHPELINSIYNSRSNLLTTIVKTRSNIYEEGYYTLTLLSNEKETDDLKLSNYLYEQKERYKISDSDIGKICSVFKAIFAGKPSDYKKTFPQYHLSIVMPSKMDRYFVSGFDGKLSDIEFSKARQLTSQEFNDKITEWAKSKDLLIDITERFEAIVFFDNKVDFEKIIKAIFHYANLPIPSSDKHKTTNSYIGYNTEFISKLIASREVNEYFDSKQSYKNFLIDIFNEVNTLAEYTYTDAFVYSLMRNNNFYVKDVFSNKELSNMIYNRFESVLPKYVNSSLLPWPFFWDCIDVESSYQGNSEHRHYHQRIDAITLFNRFIRKHGIDRFIIAIIKEVPFDKLFTINTEIVDQLFKEEKLFIRYLTLYRRNKSAIIDEFLHLYSELQNNQAYSTRAVPHSFFKAIPVKLRTQ